MLAKTPLFWRRTGIVVGCAGVYVGSVYAFYVYFGQSECCNECEKSFVNDAKRTRRFDDIAKVYDSRINFDEIIMYMPLLRRSLLYWNVEKPKSTLLEVAAGTGRNLYYLVNNKNIDRALLTDNSEPMIEEIRAKIRDYNSSIYASSTKLAVKAANAANLYDIPDNSFDIVLDTFGLCSFDNPVAVLREMARVCKPDGKILLLEHGRSTNTWYDSFINPNLDRRAESHAETWGCVWNRNLDDIILQQASEYITVDSLRKFHFGTTYYIVARPVK